MLRRDTPQSDTSELNETLRRLARAAGGSITVSLDGRPIAQVRAPDEAPRPAPRAPRP